MNALKLKWMRFRTMAINYRLLNIILTLEIILITDSERHLKTVRCKMANILTVSRKSYLLTVTFAVVISKGLAWSVLFQPILGNLGRFIVVLLEDSFFCRFLKASFENLFMPGVRISSYGCTREVWRARKMRKSISRRSRERLQPYECSPNFPSASITRYTHS